MFYNLAGHDEWYGETTKKEFLLSFRVRAVLVQGDISRKVVLMYLPKELWNYRTGSQTGGINYTEEKSLSLPAY